MTIQFEAVSQVQFDGTGRVHLTVAGRGFGTGIVAGGSASLTLSSHGVGQLFYGGGVEPQIPASGYAGLALRGAGQGFDRTFGSGVASLSLQSRGYQVAPNQGAGRALLLLSGSGRQLTAPAAYAGLEERPPMMSSFGGRWFVSPRSQLVLGGRQKSLPTTVMSEVLAVSGSRRSALQGAGKGRDVLSFGDALAVVYLLLVEEGVCFNAEVSADGVMIERVISRLLLNGRCHSYADAATVVVAGIWFGSITEALRTETVTDQLVLSDVVANLQSAAERLVDGLLASALATETGTGVVIATDRVVGGGAVTTTASMSELLREGIGFVTRLALDTGEYVAWVMNTENRALSRYTNYPFNSFAKVGGRYYAAASDGLHTLDGDDDDGTPIAARLRLGLSAMGSRRLKRLPEAFVGYSSDGALWMHVITVNEESGLKEAAIYRILERPATSPRESRWKLGKGIKAADFDFVIENVDGAAFDLSAIEFRPIYLDRRTRG